MRIIRTAAASVAAAAVITLGTITTGPLAADAAAVISCSRVVSLYNPDTNAIDNKLAANIAWKESKTASLRPEAQLSEGRNGIIIVNNHPAGGTGFDFVFAGWVNYYQDLATSAYWGDATHSPQFDDAPPGGTYGVSIDTNGNISTSGWVNNNQGAGFLQWIEYKLSATTAPELAITIKSTSTAKVVRSSVVIQAIGGPSCGAPVVHHG